MKTDFIVDAIKQRLDKIVMEEIELAKDRANKRMLEAVTAISLDMCHYFSVKDGQHHIEIHVSKETSNAR